jgi:hypothetical protein
LEQQRWLTPRADEKRGMPEQTPHQERVTEKERDGDGDGDGESEARRRVRSGREGKHTTNAVRTVEHMGWQQQAKNAASP